MVYIIDAVLKLFLAKHTIYAYITF